MGWYIFAALLWLAGIVIVCRALAWACKQGNDYDDRNT